MDQKYLLLAQAAAAGSEAVLDGLIAQRRALRARPRDQPARSARPSSSRDGIRKHSWRGSSHAGERDAAGLAIERMRRERGLSWSQIFGLE